MLVGPVDGNDDVVEQGTQELFAIAVGRRRCGPDAREIAREACQRAPLAVVERCGPAALERAERTLLRAVLGERGFQRAFEGSGDEAVLGNARTGTTDLVIQNAGGGLAHGVTFALASGGIVASERVGDGFMRGAVKALIHTDLPQSTDARCVVMWRNVDESSYAVSPGKAPVRLRKGRKGVTTTLSQAWWRVHPGVDLDAMPASRNIQITFEKPA